MDKEAPGTTVPKSIKNQWHEGESVKDQPKGSIFKL